MMIWYFRNILNNHIKIQFVVIVEKNLVQKLSLTNTTKNIAYKIIVRHAYQEHSRSDGVSRYYCIDISYFYDFFRAMKFHYPSMFRISFFISTTCYPINPLQHIMPTHQYEGESVMEFNTEQAVPISTESTNDENNNVQLQQIHETINILVGGISVLNDDIQRLSNESVRMQSSVESLTQDYASLKTSIEEHTAFLNGFNINQGIIQQDLESLKQTVDDMQYASYDGTLTWKITDFS